MASWMKACMAWVAALVFMVWGFNAAAAQEKVADNKADAGSSKAAAASLEERITALEKELAATKKSAAKPADKGVAEAAPAAAPAVDKATEKLAEKKEPSWFEKIKIFGDFRCRYEMQQWADYTPEVPDRQRLRINARLGFDAKVHKEVDLRFRIATDESKDISRGGSATSTNLTLSNYYSKKGLYLDIARVQYTSAKVKGLILTGGKMENPYFRAGKSDLIWDGDVTPEGASVGYTRAFGNFSLFSTFGGFISVENAAAREGVLAAPQVGLKYSFLEKKGYVLAGYSYYDNVDIESTPVYDITAANKSYGNTTWQRNGVTSYKYDYNVSNPFVEAGYTFDAGKVKLPVALGFDYARNLDQSVPDDTAWLIGLTIGKIQAFHDFTFHYNYRVVEKDAVVGAFADADFLGANGTDGRGHKIAMTAALAKYVSIGANAFFHEYRISPSYTTNKDTPFRMYQLDFFFQF